MKTLLTAIKMPLRTALYARYPLLFISALLLPMTAFSAPSDAQNQVREFIQSVFKDNQAYLTEVSREKFKSFAEVQSPRATVLTCSDSRVQSDAYHASPINDLFFIRNIGNQIKTTEGSIEYGINHLHTPVLFILGHTQCGAIATALGNYSQESKSIRTELDHLHLSPKITTNQGVVENVNNQVKYAMDKFKDKIQAKELVVLGAVYDFRDDYDMGHGRLILININGETDPAKIKSNDYIKGLTDVSIGLKS